MAEETPRVDLDLSEPGEWVHVTLKLPPALHQRFVNLAEGSAHPISPGAIMVDALREWFDFIEEGK